jgi:hypothetical protein
MSFPLPVRSVGRFSEVGGHRATAQPQWSCVVPFVQSLNAAPIEIVQYWTIGADHVTDPLAGRAGSFLNSPRSL